MTELLFIIGIFVFFISVYGAVMLGGHLLAELDDDQGTDSSRDQLAPPAVVPAGDR